MVPPEGGVRPEMSPGWGVALFLAGYAVLVGVVAFSSRRLAARMGEVGRSLGRFNRLLTLGRCAVPVWMGVAIYGGLGWKFSVISALGSIGLADDHAGLGLHLPAFLVGIAPAVGAWVGLWCATYPADRALREQALLMQIENDLPARRPPPLWRYILGHLRQQLLFILMPIAAILAFHDVLAVLARAVQIDLGNWDDLLQLPALLIVALLAPELLRRVLGAKPLADGPLRHRLEAICRRAGLRYRDILLWHTDFSMGNAAVMGLVPRVRYILMSDLLLETMNDRQIEAVFAHEIGHVVHHHLAWMISIAGLLVLAAAGPLQSLVDYSSLFNQRHGLLSAADLDIAQQTVVAVITLGGMFLLFGFLSRRFERQADVFAARMMESNWCAVPWGQAQSDSLPIWAASEAPAAIATITIPSIAPSRRLMYRRCRVGEQGAGVVASALHRVAIINSIPIRAWDWLHGSIAARMRYLETLGADPELTPRFDRYMARLYGGMIFALLVLGVWAACKWR